MSRTKVKEHKPLLKENESGGIIALIMKLPAEKENLTNWKDKAAYFISGGLSPFVLVPFFILLITARLSKSMQEFLTILLITFIFSTVIPFLNVYIAVRQKRITDIHVAVREERIEPFVVGILSIIGNTLALYFINAPVAIVICGMVMAINGILFFIITLYWKISMHLSILAALLTALALMIDKSFILGFVLLPLLIWARIHRKRHTLSQGITGSLLAAASTFVLFRLLGLPS